MNREKNLREFYELNAGGQGLDAELERPDSARDLEKACERDHHGILIPDPWY